MYIGLWLVVPSDSRFESDTPGAESASRGGRRPGRVRRLTDAGPAIALAALALGVILVVQATLGGGAVFWPIVIGLAGVALLWRQADEVQRERWLDTSGRLDPVRMVFGSGGAASYARVGVGVVLVVVALVVVGVSGSSFGQARVALIAGLLGVAGLALVVGPWVFRLASDLGAEREERIRTQERADVAAHLHDSVLQTLALIQKSSHDPTTVARLARAQERDLRSWLYAEESTDESSLAGALRSAAAEIEDDHGVTVDVVAVGDCDLDEPLRPVVQATREAVTNAAKHAGTGRVDVYAEVSDERGGRLRPRPWCRLRPGRRARGPVRRPPQHPGPHGAARRHRRGPLRTGRGHRDPAAPASIHTLRRTREHPRAPSASSSSTTTRCSAAASAPSWPRPAPARSRCSPRPPTSTRRWPRSPSTSLRWCCSTYTSPAVVASR